VGEKEAIPVTFELLEKSDPFFTLRERRGEKARIRFKEKNEDPFPPLLRKKSDLVWKGKKIRGGVFTNLAPNIWAEDGPNPAGTVETASPVKCTYTGGKKRRKVENPNGGGICLLQKKRQIPFFLRRRDRRKINCPVGAATRKKRKKSPVRPQNTGLRLRCSARKKKG